MEPTSLRNSAPPGHEWAFFGYVVAVSLAGAAVTAGALAGFLGAQTEPVLISSAGLSAVPPAFWLMAVFAAAADARPLSTSGLRQSVAVYPSICFSFAILLVWGLGPAIAVQTVAAGVACWRLRSTFWRALFNISQYALALAAASGAIAASGLSCCSPEVRPGLREATVVVAAAAAWFATSHGLVSTAVWLRFGGSWLRAIVRSVGYEVLATGALLLLAPLLAIAAEFSVWLIPLIVVPLYAVYRTARLSAEQERLVLLDPLTGLANRKALENEVAAGIAAQLEREADGQRDCRLALAVLDLDRFKQVNDALGHGVGDRLLVEVGERLKARVRPGDLVVRLGGDEFAVLLRQVSDVAEPCRLSEGLAAALVDPVYLDGMPLDVFGSIGIAVYPDHGEDFDTLLRHADVAMYDAKTHNSGVAVYDPAQDHNSIERLSLLADLRRALESADGGGISVYYQPQVAALSGEVVGVEALLRWRHPELGPVSPEELIRAAEHTAVMRLLTYRVLDEVIDQLAEWARAGISLRASVNVSVRDLHTTDLVDRLAARLAESAVRPAHLQLEITEGALMADPRRVLATLHRLDRLGVAIVPGRLRHRLLVDAAPAPAAAVRGQDRPVVRARDGHGRRRRRDRPVDHRAGRRARPAGGRRGGRGRPYLAGRLTRPGLPCGAGLVLRGPDVGRRANRVARYPSAVADRAAPRGRWLVLVPPAPGRSPRPARTGTDPGRPATAARAAGGPARSGGVARCRERRARRSGDRRHGARQLGNRRRGTRRSGNRRRCARRRCARRRGTRRRGARRFGDQRHGGRRFGDQRHGARRDRTPGPGRGSAGPTA